MEININNNKKPGIFICLTGYATAGKDAFADILVRNHGYEKFSWADPLYEIALACNPWMKCKNGLFCRLAAIVGAVGWTEAKKEPEVREYLQVLGTEGIRRHLGEDSFVDAVLPEIKKRLRRGVNCVVTNTRFKNEVAAGVRADGTLVRIENYRVDAPVNNHVSDAGLAFDEARIAVPNHGTLEDLELEAERLHNSLKTAQRASFHPPMSLEQMEARWDSTVDRAIALGVEAVVQCAAPYDCDSFKEWRERNPIEMSQGDGDTLSVFINNEEAGTVCYSNGILTVDVNLAR